MLLFLLLLLLFNVVVIICTCNFIIFVAEDFQFSFYIPPPLRVGDVASSSLSLLLIVVVVEDLNVVVVVGGPLLFLNLSLSLLRAYNHVFVKNGLGNSKMGENEGKSPIKSCFVIVF